jgi:hypothetical protein
MTPHGGEERRGPADVGRFGELPSGTFFEIAAMESASP